MAMMALRANAHKNQTKLYFFGKARKLKFARLLNIASKSAKGYSFFLEIVLSFREKRHLQFTFQTQFHAI